LGFKPRIASPEEQSHPTSDDESGPLPETIAVALKDAAQEGRLLLLGFHAEWCAPCKTLEETVLQAPVVRRAMDRFRLLRVDTDRHPETARHFRVAAMPTLLGLGPDGKELFRFEGLMDPEELAETLAHAARTGQVSGEPERQQSTSQH
jgi:thiol:disulfide interchange protein